MITTTENRVAYSTNGVTTTFPVPFRFIRSDELQVIHQVTGVDTVKTEGTHYSVTGENDVDGGVVTFSTAPATGTLYIVRNSDAQQEVDLVAKDNFRAETVEEALDRMTMLIQELRRKVRHTIHAPITEFEDDLENLELPFYLDRASTLLGFDSDGQLKLYDLNLDTLEIDLSVVIPDGSITAAKLASTLDLSSKTITLPNASVQANNLGEDLSLADKILTLPAESVNDPVCIPNSISSASLNPTLRLRRIAINQTTEPGIVVEGAGVSDANGIYSISGTANGRTKYLNTTGYYIQADADGLKWQVFNTSDVAVYESYHFQWESFQGTVESTPDQMPIPWYQAGTATPETAMRVTVNLADVEVNGTVKATAFVGDGSGLTNVGTGSNPSGFFKIASFPTHRSFNCGAGYSGSGSSASMIFLDDTGELRFKGQNTFGTAPYGLGQETIFDIATHKKLSVTSGTLGSAGVTHTCNNAGTSIAAISRGSVIKISQSGNVTLVLTSTGLLFAIGLGDQGALGQGDLLDQSNFVGIKVGAVSNKTIFITDFAITPHPHSAAGPGCTVIALDIDGKVWTWGEGSLGQLGAAVGDKNAPYNDPAWAFNAEIVKQVLTCGGCSWVLTTTGKVYGTGNNAYGQLGDSSTTQRTTFVLATNTGATITVDKIYAAGALDATNCKTCFYALKADGTLYSCGYGAKGALGSGGTSNINVLTVVDVSIGTISKLFVFGGYAGATWCYAIKADGSIIAWGYNGSATAANGGQLGNGTAVDSSVAVTPTGLAALLGNPTSPSDILDITGISFSSATSSNMLVLGANGVIAMSGNNSAGQLGDKISPVTAYSHTFNSVDTATTPTAVFISQHITTGGSTTAFYLDANRTLWGWGATTFGQIYYSPAGNIFINVPTPVKLIP